MSPRALDARSPASLHHILVQLADVGLRPRFAEACRAFGDIVWCDDLDDLVFRSASRQVLAVVVDVQDGAGRPSAGAVAAVRATHADLPIVLWCDRSVATTRFVSDCAGAGVSAIIFRDDSPLEQRLFGALTRATDLAYQQLTDSALARRVPESLVPVFRFVLDRAAAMPDAKTIAAAGGLSVPRLRQALRRAGMPPLGQIAIWSRLLMAAYRLEKTTDPVSEIARSVGFASPRSLSRRLEQWVNERPAALRAPGGFGWVLRCFERRLSRR